MTSTAPDWLLARGGEVRPGVTAHTWLVLLGGTPQYRIVVVPAKGKFTAVVTQTNNGRQIDGGIEYPNVEAARDGGLAELRAALGW